MVPVRYIPGAMAARSSFRLIARFAIGAVVFGQLLMAAHACSVPGSATAHRAPQAAVHGLDGSEPCGGTDEAPADTQANACEVHCASGIAQPAPPDLPPILLAALPVGAPPWPALGVATDAECAAIAPVAGAPPIALRFCRLLI